MKYKIVIVNYLDETSPDVRALTSNNEWTPFHCGRQREIEKQWKNGQGWFALDLYGVHIFECDDLETFDLLKAQKEKDEPDSITEFLESPATKKMWAEQRVRERKSEIKRIAEQIFINCVSKDSTYPHPIRHIYEQAIRFIDFDAEFEKLEGEK